MFTVICLLQKCAVFVTLNVRGYKMEELLKVGIIASTHGVRGEVKVFPTTDDVNRFKKLTISMLLRNIKERAFWSQGKMQ